MITVVRCSSPYKVPVTLLYGTRKEINAWLSKRAKTPLNETAVANCSVYSSNDDGKGEWIILSLIKHAGAVFEICALVHEVTHCAVFTFDRVGIPIEEKNDEAFAYYVENLTYQCLDGIKHKGKKR